MIIQINAGKEFYRCNLEDVEAAKEAGFVVYRDGNGKLNNNFAELQHHGIQVGDRDELLDLIASKSKEQKSNLYEHIQQNRNTVHEGKMHTIKMIGSNMAKAIAFLESRKKDLEEIRACFLETQDVTYLYGFLKDVTKFRAVTVDELMSGISEFTKYTSYEEALDYVSNYMDDEAMSSMAAMEERRKKVAESFSKLAAAMKEKA